MLGIGGEKDIPRRAALGLLRELSRCPVTGNHSDMRLALEHPPEFRQDLIQIGSRGHVQFRPGLRCHGGTRDHRQSSDDGNKEAHITSVYRYRKGSADRRNKKLARYN